MRTRTALRVTAFGCGVVLLAACGSSSSNKNASTSTGASSASASSTSTSVSSTPSGSATPSATPATIAKLATVVLRDGDLPAGWKGTAYKPDPEDSANQAALLTCVGGRDTTADKVAEAHSPDYALADATISSDAESYKTQADIEADTALLRSPKINACFNAEIRKQLATSLPAGAKVLSANVVITPGASGSGIAGTGDGTVKVSVSGQQVAVYFGVAFIAGPLLEAEVDFENVGYPVPAAIRQAAIAKIVARAKAL